MSTLLNSFEPQPVLAGHNPSENPLVSRRSARLWNELLLSTVLFWSWCLAALEAFERFYRANAPMTGPLERLGFVAVGLLGITLFSTVVKSSLRLFLDSLAATATRF